MQSFIIHEGKTIGFEIVRRKRRSIGITIKPEPKVEVAAPNWVSERQILDFVRQKADWITKKLEHFKEIKDQTPVHRYESGESLLLLGRNLQLIVRELPGVKTIKLELAANNLIVHMPANIDDHDKAGIIRSSLVHWYKKYASGIISDRVNYYSPLLGVSPAGIAIKEQKKRWGSCSSKKNLNFNWKLVMAPASIIDYVVVHELCHLREMNHSKDFWRLVEAVLPDYKEHSKWLKKNGALLEL